MKWGPEKSTLSYVRNDSVSQLARLGSLLGLDPLSRLRMTSGQKDPAMTANKPRRNRTLGDLFFLSI